MPVGYWQGTYFYWPQTYFYWPQTYYYWQKYGVPIPPEYEATPGPIREEYPVRDFVLKDIFREIVRGINKFFKFQSINTSNKFQIDRATQILQGLHIGNTTDYANFAADGELTLFGTAQVKRQVRVTAPSWKAGVTAPTAGFVGIFPVWAFDQATDDEAHYSIIVPYRIATGTTINVDIDWCYTGAQDNGTVCLKLDYMNLASGETVDGSTTTITKTTAGNHTTGKLIRTTLITGITGAVAHDDLGLRLWRDVSEDTLNTPARFIQAHFQFTMDRLGEAP